MFPQTKQKRKKKKRTKRKPCPAGNLDSTPPLDCGGVRRGADVENSWSRGQKCTRVTSSASKRLLANATRLSEMHRLNLFRGPLTLVLPPPPTLAIPLSLWAAAFVWELTRPEPKDFAIANRKGIIRAERGLEPSRSIDIAHRLIGCNPSIDEIYSPLAIQSNSRCLHIANFNASLKLRAISRSN